MTIFAWWTVFYRRCRWKLIGQKRPFLPDNTIHEAHRKLLQPLRQQIGPDVPLIAITAHAFQFDKDFLLTSGCNYFVAKPLNMSEFQKLIVELLGENGEAL